jgi:hypothetical protein
VWGMATTPNKFLAFLTASNVTRQFLVLFSVVEQGWGQATVQSPRPTCSAV